jgi:single-strand DNA-binding protein
MTMASIAVDVARDGESEDIEWYSLVGFRRAGGVLARHKHKKGDLIAAMGQLCHSRFAGRDEHERVGWRITAASVVSARTVLPGSRKALSRPAADRARTNIEPVADHVANLSDGEVLP